MNLHRCGSYAARVFRKAETVARISAGNHCATPTIISQCFAISGSLMQRVCAPRAPFLSVKHHRTHREDLQVTVEETFTEFVA